jgi:defect-in-organelle-trafficking protein DotD
MPKNKLRCLLALSAVAGLAACGTNDGARPTGPAVAYDPAIRTEVDQQIAQSSARAANALETLAMIQRARTAPAAPALDESGLPEELRRKTTLEFDGPADEAAKSLAEQIGYGFVTTGNPPANPGLVSLDEHDVSVAKALEDLGLQVQRFATVIVDPNLRRVEFRNETVPDAVTASSSTMSTSRSISTSTRHRHVAHVYKERVSGTCNHCPATPTAVMTKETTTKTTKVTTTSPTTVVTSASAPASVLPTAGPATAAPASGKAPPVPGLPPGMVAVAPANF